MWVLTAQPRKPMVHLPVSIIAGSTIASLIFAVLAWVGVFGAPPAPGDLLLVTATTLFVAPIYGCLIVLPIMMPLVWVASRLDCSGPLVVTAIGLTPFVYLAALDFSVGALLIVYPLASIAVFVRLSYFQRPASRKK